MYGRYPIGYLLFWKTLATHNSKTIGSDEKQRVPTFTMD